MSQAPKPYYKVIYNNKNITEDISNCTGTITYVDNTAGTADELSIDVDNADGRWLNAWYPEKGGKLTVEIGNLNGPILKCGTFTIDDFDASGPPDIFSIKAIAAGTTKAVRTKNSYSHDNKNLRQIVQAIAQKHGFEIIGNIPDILIGYVYQNKETDMGFLNRLGNDYGCTFNLRDNKLIFTNTQELESSNGVLTINRTDVSTYSFNDKSNGVYTGTDVKHYNARDNEVFNGSATDDDNEGEDVETIRVPAENNQQAEIKAKAALSKANSKERTGSFSTSGNTLLLAGNNFNAKGWGKLDGLYHIESSTHTVSRSAGYDTAISFKKGGTAKKIKSSPTAYVDSKQDSFN